MCIVVILFGLYLFGGVIKMKKEPIIAIPSDPNDSEDFDVSVAAVERGIMGRRIRLLRTSLGLSQDEFANKYGIPVARLRTY
jgi:putative transcriptional regulator